MRNLWRRFLALLHRPVPVALSVGTGPVLMGGSVRAEILGLTAEQRAYLLGKIEKLKLLAEERRYRDAATNFAKQDYSAAVENICGGRTWEGE